MAKRLHQETTEEIDTAVIGVVTMFQRHSAVMGVEGDALWVRHARMGGLRGERRKILFDIMWEIVAPHTDRYKKAIRVPLGPGVREQSHHVTIQPYLNGGAPNVCSALPLIAQSIKDIIYTLNGRTN